MKLAMRLTLDGLVRALRTRAAIAADERLEEARRREATRQMEARQAEAGDERGE